MSTWGTWAPGDPTWYLPIASQYLAIGDGLVIARQKRCRIGDQGRLSQARLGRDKNEAS